MGRGLLPVGGQSLDDLDRARARTAKRGRPNSMEFNRNQSDVWLKRVEISMIAGRKAHLGSSLTELRSLLLRRAAGD